MRPVEPVARRSSRQDLRRTGEARSPVHAVMRARNGSAYARLAAAFEVRASTVCRHIGHAVDLLAALVPALEKAVGSAPGKTCVLLDGTLLPIDRTAVDRPFFSGKHGEA